MPSDTLSGVITINYDNISAKTETSLFHTGIDWDSTRIGYLLGGHVRAVFTLITIAFVFCVSATITSFREVPLGMLDAMKSLGGGGTTYGTIDEEKDGVENAGYSTVPGENAPNTSETSFSENNPFNAELSSMHIVEEPPPSLRHYLKSILFMPTSIRMVCCTNLFCWMAHVCYSLYFTDFVGEAVFGGDPKVIFNPFDLFDDEKFHPLNI